MRTLVCAATWEELATFGGVPEGARDNLAKIGETGYFVTGVGIPSVLVQLLDIARRERPEQILTIGIAGAYPGSGLTVGSVVTAKSEVYGDLGMELPEPPGFLPLSQTAFGGPLASPFAVVPYRLGPDLPIKRGCTVNSCTGSSQVGELREKMFDAAFETMEGAAVAHIGVLLSIPVSEVRAISNVAARRDMKPANIHRAMRALGDFFGCEER